jgi:hypothetical protein
MVAGTMAPTASRMVARIVSVTCSMYQSGTKPHPPMKSGAAWLWVAAITIPAGSMPSSAPSVAPSCLAPQSSHLVA